MSRELDHINRKIFENECEVARINIRVENLWRNALQDAELIDAVRLQCWLRHDRSSVKGWRDAAGTHIECPDGWPEDVDPRWAVFEAVQDRLGEPPAGFELAANDDG